MTYTYRDEIRAASEVLVQAILKHEPELRLRLRSIDADVQRMLRGLGLDVLKNIFSAVVDGDVKEAERVGLKQQRQAVLSFSVIFGQLDVVAPYLWTKGDARNIAAGLGLHDNGRSKTVERALSDFGAEESFGQATVRFKEHYGFHVGRTTVLRVVEKHAHAMDRYVDERLAEVRSRYSEVPKPKLKNDNPDGEAAAKPKATATNAPILVELDGCEIRTGTLSLKPGDEKTPKRGLPVKVRTTAWRDVRVGFARRLGEVDRTYVARMSEYPEVVGQLFSAAVDRELTSTTKVYGVGDGGNGLVEELKAQFPTMSYLLDRPHLKSHLYEAADAQGLTGDAREKRIQEQLAIIDDGRVDDVITELKLIDADGHDRARQLANHLTRFHDCLDYNGNKKAGAPIGSGEIESAHRSIPQKRMKLPGAWWDPDNMNAMLAMRVTKANGWWDDYWSAAAS